ncbi:asparaginase [Arthrobacter sp. UM1]|uniref:asparaginase n=1 Tax=Arthrobacter sp. UM1 TaxID=2766776 RepID=UPI001CF6BBDD|nr:asparaginase [Arthrobacter sp. UM1]MCB4207370.1 asparaginase [Arthrobacter sp. UM1]
MTHVHILGTGGTIASRSGGHDAPEHDGDRGHALPKGSVASVGVGELAANAGSTAEPGRGGLEVTSEDVLTVGSYRLGLGELREIAAAVLRSAGDPDVDGIVVTHGTDTLEESAFLVDLVNDTETPVVFTGAQRAADHADTDGPRNLRQSIAVAADPRFRGMGALVCFDGLVQSARGARKAHTLASQPFEGGAVVAEFAGEEIDVVARPERKGRVPLPPAAFGETRVDIVTAFPGSAPEALLHAAERGAAGVVLAGTGLGNAGPGFAEAVADLTRRGLPVVLASRALAGPVLPVYGNGGGVDLIAAGAVSAGRLNPFQARILAACLLAGRPSLTDFTRRFSELR